MDEFYNFYVRTRSLPINYFLDYVGRIPQGCYPYPQSFCYSNRKGDDSLAFTYAVAVLSYLRG